MLNFDNTYARLPEAFFERRTHTNSFRPSILARNEELMHELGIDFGDIPPDELAEGLVANRFFPGSEPIAMAYAGHQFGHFSPSLGDGRALLLGEFLGKDGVRHDLHLKGSGRTRFSRRGDGLSALGPVIREYLLSEAFHALGIPGTRSLAALRTGELVHREEAKPGGVLARVARSHIRIGTFQYFAARNEWVHLKTLADYTIERLYPELQGSSDYLPFWKAVADKQIALVAQWMAAGFIHGVMNTDNINLSGETIDFGPCAFLDEYDPQKVFSSIDENGRYRYDRQPQILFWNLARFAECLIPVGAGTAERESARFTAALPDLHAQFEEEYESRMLKKLGLTEGTPARRSLLTEWLGLLGRHSLDFTLAHVDLERVLEGKPLFTVLGGLPGFSEWLARWEAQLRAQGSTAGALRLLQSENPVTIPRNHQVERVIGACERGEDSLFFDFLRAIRAPFSRGDAFGASGSELDEYQRPPRPEERVQQTFCGT